MKKCSKCKETKPLSCFHKNKRRGDGRNTYCKTCAIQYKKEYYRKNKPKIREYALQKRYKITQVEFDTLLKQQDNCCACCGVTKPDRTRENLAVDHNHTTGKVRGLLCTRCNTVLGLVRDSPQILSNLIKYIERENDG